MNFLTDIIPAAYRRYLYAAYALACLVVGALAVAGLDVDTARDVLAYLGIGIGATAASNTLRDDDPSADNSIGNIR